MHRKNRIINQVLSVFTFCRTGLEYSCNDKVGEAFAAANVYLFRVHVNEIPAMVFSTRSEIE